MSVDYQARNFKCYTVHESNSEDDNCVSDDTAKILSSNDDDSSSTLAPSSGDEWPLRVQQMPAAATSWGYFVPFQPYCYFSPPVQRRFR